jgi:hypothetical protein
MVETEQKRQIGMPDKTKNVKKYVFLTLFRYPKDFSILKFNLKHFETVKHSDIGSSMYPKRVAQVSKRVFYPKLEPLEIVLLI